MTKFTIPIFLILISNLVLGTHAQLSGTYNVGTGQTYTSLTRAGGFFAAVNSQGLSGNVTVNITSNITNENGANDLNQWSGAYTITIRPSAATERLIEGNVNDAMIKLNGADRVTFDGRYNGSGKYLRFRNTNTNNCTFTFINDASNNTITYCYIESGNSSTNSSASIGGILFSTTTGSQGNDNNTISYCDIRDRSDANGNPAYLIYSYGTATSTARYNSGNQILNNNIYNFWKNGSYCGAIYLSNGTGDNWVISGNSFYQTTANISTSNASGGWNVIFLNYTGINNCTVSGNYIGGSAPNCGGTPWTSSTSANGTLQLPCIRADVGSNSPSSIQGNTITNMDFSTRTSNGAFPFVGILVETGTVNVGDVTGNVIGSAIGTGSIMISYTNNGFYTIYARGIDHRSDGNVQNNTIGSITISSSSNNTSIFEALSYVSSPASDVTISNNLIGSSSTANSLQHVSTTYTAYLRGIVSTITGANVTITGNTIANMTNYSTGNNSINYAMINTGDGASITNNIIHDINSPLTNTQYIGTLGIGNTSSASSQLIQGNTIYNLNSTSTSASNTSVVALHVEGQTGSGTISRNRVYGLSNTATGSGPIIFALNAFWGSWTASNNQITVTNGAATDNIPYSSVRTAPNTNRVLNTERVYNSQAPQQSADNMLPAENDIIKQGPVKNTVQNTRDEIDATNGVILQGIHDESDGVWNYYYNSVYVGGTASSGNMNSYCYARQNFGPSTVTFRNNLFFNARTGGTGTHYAIANEYGNATGWSAAASNYNAFVSSNANTVAEWMGTNRTIDQWRTSSGGDKQSWSVTTAQITAANLFSSIPSGNLNIQSGNSSAWLVSGKGIAVAGQNTDYEGTTRVTAITGGTTDIGSDEFAATPPSCPAATISNAPGSGVTSNFTLYGRNIVTINWGTGGTSYPTSMNVQYYSGVNPPAILGGNYSNSYWVISIGSGSLSGATYTVTINFGDNETYTITTPSSNTLLAKSNGTWEVFPAGGGTWQTQLSWANLYVRTSGLTGFSNFALTDATSPLPVLLSYFGATVNRRNTELKWITEMEINNKGFSVQRRENDKGNYTDWKEVAFVNGKGNTNNQTVYNYTDSKMTTGNYQYRLKQVDYNGNFEYFNLQNPAEVVIGVPSSIGVSQNYPNPSNPKSFIDYQLTFNGKVSLIVYDMAGREVSTLVNETKDPGYYTAQFDGSNLASGVYIYRLVIEGEGQKFVKSNKMVLVK